MDSLVPNPQLKNRIFGAILLVILAVLLIPMFLGEPKSSIKKIEAEQKAEFQSKIQPLPEEGEATETTSLDPLAITSQNADGSDNIEDSTGLVLKTINSPSPVTPQAVEPEAAKVQPEDTQAVEKLAEPTQTQVTKKEEPKVQKIENIKEGWALQAGIFSKKENAVSIAKILKKHDFNPNAEQIQASFGKGTRVWLGPYDTKEQAQKVSAKLESIIGSGGYIAPYPFK